MKLLTKTAYLAGLESDAYLWTLINDKESLPPPNPVLKERFDEGSRIGELARTLHDGIDLSDLSFEENLEKTEENIGSVLYEAGFLHERLYARVDILIPTPNGHELIEVKSSTNAKPIHAEDLAYQKHVLERCGLTIRSCSVIHLNSNYERRGAIDPHTLFARTDITTQVEAISDITTRIERMLTIIDEPRCPPFSVHDIARSEYGNPLIDQFRNDLPAGSIFELSRIRAEDAAALWESGVQLIRDLPDTYPLTEKQRIQRQAQDGTQINHQKLARFLHDLTYPIIHLDFETFMDPIPPYENLHPYEQIPFQYSLHIEHTDHVEHKEYLHEGSDDPRRAFTEHLLADIPPEGSILAYYAPFEKGRLRDMARLYPEHADTIVHIIERITDLLVPFQNHWYHNARQKGSCSIKAVLPLFSDKNHKGLAISDGAQAMLAYKRYRGELSEQMRTDLLEYCALDTEAMVIILRALRKAIQISPP